MLLIRDTFHCKPGKVRPMVEKFKAMARIMEKQGMGKMRVLTDLAGSQFWTIVSEFEVENFDAFMNMDANTSEEDMKQFEEIMKDYHDHIDHGHREIYTIVL